MKDAAARPWTRAATGIELAAVYASILLFIWRWQASHPWLWIPIWAFIILTHVLHHDTLRAMGLTLHEIRGNAALILPLAAAVYGGAILWGLATHRLALHSSVEIDLGRLAGYGVWCCVQQYLMQSYFHRRLMLVLRRRNLPALVVALMFCGAHVPNPVLMAVTAAGGFVLAEVFARHPNIWPLAFVQAIGGMLVGALTPAALIHHMRVGPGYYNYPAR